jgi:glucose-1-phosphate adenylyltransferase
VPIAGKYRLIDIPVSNCIHSGLHRIFVLTQFNSVSLHRHIYNTYKFDPFSGGFVEILAAQQTMQHESWYQGTADAVRRNIPYFTEKSYDFVLILSGDQLYRMNFQEMIRTHVENKAVVTIAALPVAEAEARSCGIMRIQADGKVIDFEEKPKTQEKLNRDRTDPAWLEKLVLKAAGRPYLASMGIYLFNARALVDLLEASDATDFGHEILPQTITNHRVQAHLFDGYWEDIGTVGAFHQANIDLTRDVPSFDFTSGEQPIFTRPRYLPCSRLGGATVKNSLICDGCIIGRGVVIENSVIGVRSIIGENTTIRDSYLMGIDYYEQANQIAENQRQGRPGAGIGAGSVIERAIIDKNARIGRNVRVINDTGIVDSEETTTHVIRDGVTVIPKSAILRDGIVI